MNRRPLTRAEVRSLDTRAIKEYGMPGVLLMENAGRNAAEAIRQRFAVGSAPLRVLIVTGKGNNGGDGFVIARHLQAAGHYPTILSAVDPEQIAVIGFCMGGRIPPPV